SAVTRPAMKVESRCRCSTTVPPPCGMEHLWSQAGAAGGNQRQFVWTPETQTSCKQLHPDATNCRAEPMVRRGSTVRVRQRASKAPAKHDLFGPPDAEQRYQRMIDPEGSCFRGVPCQRPAKLTAGGTGSAAGGMCGDVA